MSACLNPITRLWPGLRAHLTLPQDVSSCSSVAPGEYLSAQAFPKLMSRRIRSGRRTALQTDVWVSLINCVQLKLLAHSLQQISLSAHISGNCSFKGFNFSISNKTFWNVRVTRYLKKSSFYCTNWAHQSRQKLMRSRKKNETFCSFFPSSSSRSLGNNAAFTPSCLVCINIYTNVCWPGCFYCERAGLQSELLMSSIFGEFACFVWHSSVCCWDIMWCQLCRCQATAAQCIPGNVRRPQIMSIFLSQLSNSLQREENWYEIWTQYFLPPAVLLRPGETWRTR